jgi:hypothetical protein
MSSQYSQNHIGSKNKELIKKNENTFLAFREHLHLRKKRQDQLRKKHTNMEIRLPEQMAVNSSQEMSPAQEARRFSVGEVVF